MQELVRRVQRSYPQIYGACHVRHVRAATTEHGVSSRDSAILAHLDERRPLRAADLAAHLGIGPSTLSAALDRLEALGYVRRRKSALDARTLDLTLGPRGLEALAGTSVLDAERVALVLSRLTEAERKRAAAGLDLLARASRELMLEMGHARAAARKKRRSS
jgi:DNA-binding MarR family transcriptional regulator